VPEGGMTRHLPLGLERRRAAPTRASNGRLLEWDRRVGMVAQCFLGDVVTIGVCSP